MTTTHRQARPWNDPNLAHVSGFRTGEDDLAYTIPADQIRGSLPEGLHGIFMRNGPARNELAGKPFGHWFDGDGCVHTFRIENGEVAYRCSFVKTPKYVDETAAQRVKYRSYGHNAPGGFFKNLHMPANAANTSIVYHGGRLLTLFEGGLPWEMDLDTLETLGPYDFDGALKKEIHSAHTENYTLAPETILISGWAWVLNPKSIFTKYRQREKWCNAAASLLTAWLSATTTR